MKIRTTLGILVLVIAGLQGSLSSNADAAVTQSICNVTSVGWREDIKALRVICGGTVFFDREATANPTCSLKTSLDAVKIFQTTADAALLSGKTVQIFYDTQSVCSSDLVIREMYLLN